MSSKYAVTLFQNDWAPSFLSFHKSRAAALRAARRRRNRDGQRFPLCEGPLGEGFSQWLATDRQARKPTLCVQQL